MRKLFGLILGLTLIGFCAASSFAQNNPQTKPKARTRTVTGCLAKGDNPDEYKLTTKNGAVWELRSGESMNGSVNLAEHVGHTVAVTGTVGKPSASNMNMKEQYQETQTPPPTEGGAKKHEHGGRHMELSVTAIKHISDTCS